MTWTEKRIELAHSHYRNGCSSGVIAKIMGVTRNSVCGLVERLGWSDGSRAPKICVPRRPAAPRPDILIAKIRGAANKRAKAEAVEAEITTPETDLAIPAEQRKSLVELDARTCRWPVGHPLEPGFFFCGSPTADMTVGRPYCPSHSRRAFP